MVRYVEMQACSSLPRDWERGLTCPVCGGSRLSIEPQMRQADQMSCGSCSAAFEVAQDGVHVHLVKGPARLLEETGETWQRPGELRDLALRLATERRAVETAAPAAARSREDLLQRAVGLRRLGNSTERIREVLFTLPGAQAEDVRAVMQELMASQETRQRKTLKFAYGWIVILLAIAGLAALWVTQGEVLADLLEGPNNPSAPLHALASLTRVQGAATPVASSSGVSAGGENQFIDLSSLSPELQTAVPAGVKVLKPPEVIIHRGTYTGRTEHCPASAGDAVRLFGGDLKIWTKSRGGWTMISTSPQSLTIPEGMSVGYLLYVSKPEFYSVAGPVTIENLNFAAVSCE